MPQIDENDTRDRDVKAAMANASKALREGVGHRAAWNALMSRMSLLRAACAGPTKLDLMIRWFAGGAGEPESGHPSDRTGEIALVTYSWDLVDIAIESAFHMAGEYPATLRLVVQSTYQPPPRVFSVQLELDWWSPFGKGDQP